MKKHEPPSYALLVAGGSGERLWPISRKEKPKQFLNIDGKGSLLDNTAERISKIVPRSKIFVVAPEKLEKQIRNELKWLKPANMILEPEGRNTGPAIALSAARLANLGLNDHVGFFLPADHHIGNTPVYLKTMNNAARIAAEYDMGVTIGIKPEAPNTAYGYLKTGKMIGRSSAGARRLVRFVEKPTSDRAKALIRAGCLINSGMFIFRTSVLMEGLKTFAPQIYFDPEKIGGSKTKSFKLGKKARNDYLSLKPISLDHALMEKGPDAAVIPGTGFKWSDIGGYKTIHSLLSKGKKKANVGANVAIDSQNNLVMSKKLVACIGVENIVLIEEDDAILVCSMDRANDVKLVVNKLKKGGMNACI